MTELRTIRKGDTITVADPGVAYPPGTEFHILTVYSPSAVAVDEDDRLTILIPDLVVWDRREVQL